MSLPDPERRACRVRRRYVWIKFDNFTFRPTLVGSAGRLVAIGLSVTTVIGGLTSGKVGLWEVKLGLRAHDLPPVQSPFLVAT